jgi:alkanesulfonate monooxygenase SsuD/methylene tetrahydromethanopterin reductase-like flavin-dependent oxidoreductase (luciferase family)
MYMEVLYTCPTASSTNLTFVVETTFGGNADFTYLAGSTIATLDPVVYVSAMAAVTQSVAFGITGSTSYITVRPFSILIWGFVKDSQPYILARTWGTLDHATKGRVAWNVVTSYGDSSAKAMGRKKITPHDQRYEEAHEYMDLMYS